jgi:hypothetical protein
VASKSKEKEREKIKRPPGSHSRPARIFPQWKLYEHSNDYRAKSKSQPATAALEIEVLKFKPFDRRVDLRLVRER